MKSKKRTKIGVKTLFGITNMYLDRIEKKNLIAGWELSHKKNLTELLINNTEGRELDTSDILYTTSEREVKKMTSYTLLIFIQSFDKFQIMDPEIQMKTAIAWQTCIHTDRRTTLVTESAIKKQLFLYKVLNVKNC